MSDSGMEVDNMGSFVNTTASTSMHAVPDLHEPGPEEPASSQGVELPPSSQAVQLPDASDDMVVHDTRTLHSKAAGKKHLEVYTSNGHKYLWYGSGGKKAGKWKYYNCAYCSDHVRDERNILKHLRDVHTPATN